MKKALAVCIVVLTMIFVCTPVFAAGTVFTAIPNEYYINVFEGAALQGLLLKHTEAPMESFYVSIGIAVAREIVNSTLLGGQFDWEEAGATVLGSSFVYYF